jgi:hypothetical protein
MAACGSAPPVETSAPHGEVADPEPPAVASAEPETETAPAVEPTAPPTEEEAAEARAAGEAERLGPFTASSADEVREVLQTASTDVVALRRLIDTQRGVGTVGPGEAGMRHWCDSREMTTQPSLEFVIGTQDTFRCDRQLRRCALQEPRAGGYVFYFRPMDETGGNLLLDGLIHYDRRVPNTESRAVRSFLQAGDDVCLLHRRLADDDATPPARFSVLVTAHTGLVPETLTEHHCGDPAASAYQVRVAARAQAGATDRCDRDPTRCTYRTRDEDVTVYADDDGPFAVTVTRHSMRTDLDRAQERELATFLGAARRHRCEE